MSCSSSGMEGALGDSQGAEDGSYSPQEALELALREWVAEINQQALEPGRQWICTSSKSSSLNPWSAGVGGEEPPPCPSGGSLGLVWQQGRACHAGQVWVSILLCCPVGAPAVAAAWRGFPWLAEPELGPALEEEVSQG